MIHQVKVTDADLYMLLISELRYSIARDNHLAPGAACNLIRTYLPKIGDYWRSHTAKQLLETIIEQRIVHTPNTEVYTIKSPEQAEAGKQLLYDIEWEQLCWFLLGFITDLPYNANHYMRCLYGKMDYYAKGFFGIDFYADEDVKEMIRINKYRAKLGGVPLD